MCVYMHNLLPVSDNLRSGVARVLGARGQNALMAPPPPPPPSPWPKTIHPLRLGKSEYWGGGGGGQIRLLPFAFGNGYMNMRGVPLHLTKSGVDPGFRCGGEMMAWRDTPTSASGVWGGSPAASQLSHF